MDISAKLADLATQYRLENAFTPENARPAIYAFDGDVYTGVDAYSIPIEKLEKLQDSLRILSVMGC
jgi:cytoplasmic iron level regulating protein YaaA (DUF328/UPF0246 family)